MSDKNKYCHFCISQTCLKRYNFTPNTHNVRKYNTKSLMITLHTIYLIYLRFCIFEYKNQNLAEYEKYHRLFDCMSNSNPLKK